MKADKNDFTTSIKVLEGVLEEIDSDGIVSAEEINILKDWIDNHRIQSALQDYGNCIKSVEKIISDGIVSNDEYNSLMDYLHASVKSSNRIYSSNTLALQELKGILTAIVYDNKIDASEIDSLMKWMGKNSELKGIYPFDKIYEEVTKITQNKIVTVEESDSLLHFLNHFINPVEDSCICDENFQFDGKVCCLTGNFINGSKAEVSNWITERGGIIVKSVTKKTQVLLVGGQGNDAWAYGNYGEKVKKAMQLQENGVGIEIIKEQDVYKNSRGRE